MFNQLDKLTQAAVGEHCRHFIWLHKSKSGAIIAPQVLDRWRRSSIKAPAVSVIIWSTRRRRWRFAIQIWATANILYLSRPSEKFAPAGLDCLDDIKTHGRLTHDMLMPYRAPCWRNGDGPFLGELYKLHVKSMVQPQYLSVDLRMAQDMIGAVDEITAGAQNCQHTFANVQRWTEGKIGCVGPGIRRVVECKPEAISAVDWIVARSTIHQFSLLSFAYFEASGLSDCPEIAVQCLQSLESGSKNVPGAQYVYFGASLPAGVKHLTACDAVFEMQLNKAIGS
jgi:hypothetical protein